MKLSELPVGDRAAVVEFPGQSQACVRLREMGVIPGTILKLVRMAPLGDPLEIQVLGYCLTLRRADADQIQVMPSCDS